MIGLILTGPALAADAPPTIDIPNSALRAGLLPDHVGQIREGINYWAEKIRQAGGDEKNAEKMVISARGGLLFYYRQYESTRYRYTFSREAAAILSALLKNGLTKDDPFLQLKEVNVAMALSQMSQVPIQDALEAMVVHRNAAVRYLGWKGYRRVRRLLLAQGGNFSKTMFRTLASRAAKEDSPPILAAIFQMLYLLPDAGRLVSQEALTDAQNQAFEILHANWGRCCRLLLTGGAGMAEALEKGIGSLQGMASLVAAKSDGKKAVLQMIVDAMYCSFLAYDAHCAKADRSDVAVRTNASLLLTCEKALSEISEIRKTTVEDALTNPRVPDRPAAVGLAVLDWVEALKDLGVIKPDFKMPAEKAETGNQAPK